jgi:ABC-type iron transport system FetAB ATPase subunit
MISAPAPDPAQQAIFEAHGLRFRVGARSHEVSFRLAPGEVLQVAGPSGCGKTTLLRVLCRLAPAEGGALLLSGVPTSGIAPWDWRRRVAYCAQRPVMLPGTVRENLEAAFASRRAASRLDLVEVRRLLAALELSADDALLGREARVLSGGEAARLALCRAVLTRPAVLLADEPAAALGEGRAERMVALLRDWTREGGALIVVAHHGQRWADLADRRLELASEEAR